MALWRFVIFSVSFHEFIVFSQFFHLACPLPCAKLDSLAVTAANDEVSQVGKVFLQLKLVVDRAGTRETVPMELTLPQFYAFLHEMQKAQVQLR